MQRCINLLGKDILPIMIEVIPNYIENIGIDRVENIINMIQYAVQN